MLEFILIITEDLYRCTHKYCQWDEAYEAIRNAIADEYKRHLYLLTSEKCNEFDRKYFRSVMEGTVTTVGLASAFCTLSNMLHIHHGQPPESKLR